LIYRDENQHFPGSVYDNGLLIPYTGLRSKYELVALMFQSLGSLRNNEWVTTDAKANVKLE
jgi:hypothetical protein